MENHSKEALVFARDHFTRMEERIADQIGATFRWVLATLFTANGGAIITLLNSGEKLPGKLWSAAWFSLGMIFAILMGVASIYVSLRASVEFTKIHVKAREGLAADNDVSGEVAALANALKVDWTPTRLGVVSFAFFVFGLGTIAGSLIRAAYSAS